MTGVYHLCADIQGELEYARLPHVTDGHIKHLCRSVDQFVGGRCFRCPAFIATITYI